MFLKVKATPQVLTVWLLFFRMDIWLGTGKWVLPNDKKFIQNAVGGRP